MKNSFELNWEALSKLEDEDRISAMFYLLQAMKITISRNVYDSLSAKGKRYFKLS